MLTLILICLWLTELTNVHIYTVLELELVSFSLHVGTWRTQSLYSHTLILEHGVKCIDSRTCMTDTECELFSSYVETWQTLH